jgi:hypothetical protein
VDEHQEPVAAGAPPPPPAPAPSPPPPPPDAPSPPGPAEPGWGTPGQPPTGWGQPAGGAQPWGAASPDAQVSWDRPSSGSNGCLKGCLIVGGILAVLAVVAIVGLVIAGGRLVQQIEENPDSVLGGACPYVSSADVSDALAMDAQVFELTGLADGTMGAILDKRLLRDAPDCYIISEGGTAGRIAVLDGGGQAAYDTALAEAQQFTGRDVPLGDQAVCTTLDNNGFAGVLVRFGDRVAYVSVLDQSLDEDLACTLASAVAETLAP